MLYIMWIIWIMDLCMVTVGLIIYAININEITDNIGIGILIIGTIIMTIICIILLIKYIL